jgi:hypothetical protein
MEAYPWHQPDVLNTKVVNKFAIRVYLGDQITFASIPLNRADRTGKDSRCKNKKDHG